MRINLPTNWDEYPPELFVKVWGESIGVLAIQVDDNEIELPVYCSADGERLLIRGYACGKSSEFQLIDADNNS